MIFIVPDAFYFINPQQIFITVNLELTIWSNLNNIFLLIVNIGHIVASMYMVVLHDRYLFILTDASF